MSFPGILIIFYLYYILNAALEFELGIRLSLA